MHVQIHTPKHDMNPSTSVANKKREIRISWLPWQNGNIKHTARSTSCTHRTLQITPILQRNTCIHRTLQITPILQRNSSRLLVSTPCINHSSWSTSEVTDWKDTVSYVGRGQISLSVRLQAICGRGDRQLELSLQALQESPLRRPCKNSRYCTDRNHFTISFYEDLTIDITLTSFQLKYQFYCLDYRYSRRLGSE